VTQSAGVLTITSNRYGSASTVALTGGSARPDLFSTPAETAGADAAGSIGGVAATGSGQTLTGAGDASGLQVQVAGGVTGFRGSVSVSHGYAWQLDKLAGKILANDNLLDSRMDGINASIKNIASQREALARRLELTEKRYRAQFSALDGMITSMSKTSSFLQQQLASLPKAGQ
jgi:flagellar hook-associated protein 2